MNKLRFLLVFALLYGFWILLSGFFTPFLLTAGFFCSLGVAMLCQRLGLLDAEDRGLRWNLKPLGFLVWLIVEIVKSSWLVTRIILHPALPISPTLVRFRPSQTSALGLVVHANSITLTPGTYTIEASATEFLVHGLTSSGADNDVDSETDRRVCALEWVV